MPEMPSVDPHEERLNEVRLDQGIWDQTMVDAEVAGTWAESTIPQKFNESPLAQTMKAERASRSPAVPGLERGAISGRDQSRLIANEAYKEAVAEGKIGQPLSEDGNKAKETARKIAHNARYKSFLNSILDLPVNEQMAQIRAWEEKNPSK